MSGRGGRPPAEIERDLAIPSLTRLRLMTAGPSASVFRAYQTATQRTVAVKVLHDELSSDVGQRFDRERAITGQLSGHTGVVPLLHTGTTADGEPYLVLPYYRRGSLADLMGRYGPLPWREATFLMKPVASTVAEVHLWGLVHRNLKPSNILLTDFLRPRVADFGMCLPLDQSSTAATLVGGPYAPDESGVIGPADPTVDVFGLAATLWSLLAGRPFVADDADRRVGPGEIAMATTRLTRSRRPELPGVDTPRRIVELIEKSMSPDVEDRPATVAAFLAELRHDDFRTARTTSPRAAAASAPTTRRPGPDIERGSAPGEPTEPVPAAPVSTDPVPASAPAAVTVSRSTTEPTRTSTAIAAVAPDVDDSATSSAAEAVTSSTVGSSPSDTLAQRADGMAGHVYYLLALVALIVVGIVVMVAAAIFAL